MQKEEQQTHRRLVASIIALQRLFRRIISQLMTTLSSGSSQFVLGLSLAIAGLAIWSVPLALLVAGLLIAANGLLTKKRHNTPAQ